MGGRVVGGGTFQAGVWYSGQDQIVNKYDRFFP